MTLTDKPIITGIFNPLARKLERINPKIHCYTLARICLRTYGFLSFAAGAFCLWHFRERERDREFLVIMALMAIGTFLYFEFAYDVVTASESDLRKELEKGSGKNPQLDHPLNILTRQYLLLFMVEMPIFLRFCTNRNDQQLDAQLTLILFTAVLPMMLYACLSFTACVPAYLIEKEGA